MTSWTAVALLAAFLAAACSGESRAPSAEQNREMENASEMLDEAPERLSQIDDRDLLGNAGNNTQPPGGAQQE